MFHDTHWSKWYIHSFTNKQKHVLGGRTNNNYDNDNNCNYIDIKFCFLFRLCLQSRSTCPHRNSWRVLSSIRSPHSLVKTMKHNLYTWNHNTYIAWPHRQNCVYCAYITYWTSINWTKLWQKANISDPTFSESCFEPTYVNSIKYLFLELLKTIKVYHL